MKKIMLILLAAAAILLVGCSKGTLMENDRIGTNSLFIDPATIKIENGKARWVQSGIKGIEAVIECDSCKRDYFLIYNAANQHVHDIHTDTCELRYAKGISWHGYWDIKTLKEPYVSGLPSLQYLPTPPDMYVYNEGYDWRSHDSYCKMICVDCCDTLTLYDEEFYKLRDWGRLIK